MRAPEEVGGQLEALSYEPEEYLYQGPLLQPLPEFVLEEEQEKEFKEIFDLFDHDLTKTLDAREMASLMRALDCPMEEREVRAMITVVPRCFYNSILSTTLVEDGII